MKTKSNILSSFIDLIFPRTCFCCRQRIQEGIICEKCCKELVWLEDVCEFCGSLLTDRKCPVCFQEDFVFDKARSVFSFNKVIQSYIHDLKYEEMTIVAELLGDIATDYLKHFEPFCNLDIIAPVPLHRVKKRQRGFNQSEMITKQMAAKLQLRHLPDLVIRNRFTQTQTQLGKADRKQNVRGAFNLNDKYKISGKNILIVDDVFTTGATLNSIAALLKQTAAAKVYAFTLARA